MPKAPNFFGAANFDSKKGEKRKKGVKEEGKKGKKEKKWEKNEHKF